MTATHSDSLHVDVNSTGQWCTKCVHAYCTACYFTLERYIIFSIKVSDSSKNTPDKIFFFFFNVSIPNFYDHLPWLCLWFLMQKIQEFHMSRWEALTTESFCSMWLILVSPLFEGCKVYSSDLMNPLTSSLQIHKCSDLQMLQNHRHIGDARSINNVNKDHHNWIGILQARNIIFPCNL